MRSLGLPTRRSRWRHKCAAAGGRGSRWQAASILAMRPVHAALLFALFTPSAAMRIGPAAATRRAFLGISAAALAPGSAGAETEPEDVILRRALSSNLSLYYYILELRFSPPRPHTRDHAHTHRQPSGTGPRQRGTHRDERGAPSSRGRSASAGGAHAHDMYMCMCMCMCICACVSLLFPLYNAR